jgi:death-on-curing protein
MDDAHQAHEFALEYGGRPGILDAGRIEAAINRPYSGYFRSIAAKAAALLEAIINNHGFVDGNKRTAILVTDLLIKKSGYRLTAADENEDLDRSLEELAVSVARGELQLADITSWFKQHLTRQQPS